MTVLKRYWPYCPNAATKPESRAGALCVIPPGTLHCPCQGRSEHDGAIARVFVDDGGQLCWRANQDDRATNMTFTFVALRQGEGGQEPVAIPLKKGEVSAPTRHGQHGFVYTLFGTDNDRYIVRAEELVRRAVHGEEFVDARRVDDAR